MSPKEVRASKQSEVCCDEHNHIRYWAAVADTVAGHTGPVVGTEIGMRRKPAAVEVTGNRPLDSLPVAGLLIAGHVVVAAAVLPATMVVDMAEVMHLAAGVQVVAVRIETSEVEGSMVPVLVAVAGHRDIHFGQPATTSRICSFLCGWELQVGIKAR